MNNQAKQQAVADIMQDLYLNGKCFIAFRSNLNPVMNHLVDDYLKEQSTVRHHSRRRCKVKGYKIAHCFFTLGQVDYKNYEKNFIKR